MSPNEEPAKMEEEQEQEQEQNEGSATDKPKNEIIPSSQRGARLKEELLSKIVPWEKITVSLDNFPYYIEEHTKSLLMECVVSHLKHNKLGKYRARLKSSSQRILLQSIQGTELYRERLASALAREMQVPLLKFDEYDDYDEEEDDSEDEVSRDEICTLRKGNRVKYVGKTISIEEVNNRTLSYGQRGEVYEVNGKRVAVVFNICGLKTMEAEEDEKNTEISRQAIVTWLDVRDVKKDLEVRIHDCYIAMEVLYQVVESQKPVIVYFPDSFLWPSKSDYTHKQFLDPFSRASKSEHRHKQFTGPVKKIFNRLPEGVVIICAQNKCEAGPEEMEIYEFTKRPLRAPREHQVSDLHKLFTNVVCIKPPKDQGILNTFIKEIEEDGLTAISESYLSTMHKVLKANNLSCMNLEHAKVEDMILTREKVEKIIGWATNHYISSCPFPRVNEEKLNIPDESIKLAILRLKEEEEKETQSKKQAKSIKYLASGRHEQSLVSAVVFSEDIGVKFDDVGALENVKKLLYETVILPMKRPELFSHGNLLRPCKGILLFGPPGTGKTLVAKALATESGANFINITAATITSKWVGETENLTRALFSYATKLAPVIIFVDEADSLLGARGCSKHGTSRLNEFMASWDGLTSKDSQRVLVMGATNRPFDLDDAVLRRMPRRIYVGLPDVENRSKILKILLNKENLESGFSFEQLAEATEGYSGSDLKNLCIAAAYRPIEEFLEQESKGEASDGVPAPRSLNLNDFIHSKAKVRPSVARNACSIIKLREWNEQYGEGESQRQQI